MNWEHLQPVIVQTIRATIDDVKTWRDLLQWALSEIQNASPWLAPLTWGALFLTLVVLWVKADGWGKVKAISKWMQRAVGAVDQLLTLVDDMAYVKGQLQNNGGSTVKDSAQKSERILVDLKESFARVEVTAEEAKSTAVATQRLLIEHITKSTT